jgi:hypothetical protein
MHKYTLAVQSVDVLAFGGLPVAVVSFDASLDRPWSVQTEDLTLTVNTVVGEQSSGGLVFYHTASVGNKVRGIKKDLVVTTSEYKQVVKGSEFFWWAPAVDLSLVGMIDLPSLDLAVGGNISLSLMGYGRDKDRLDWRFISLGAGVGTGWFLTASPVKYRLPLLTNLWVGPEVVYKGSWGMGISLGARL